MEAKPTVEQLMEADGIIIACESPFELQVDTEHQTSHADGELALIVRATYEDMLEESWAKYNQELKHRQMLPFLNYTCARCKLAPTCEFSFDDYNTDGDCLETK